jgi:hypothetical protein
MTALISGSRRIVAWSWPAEARRWRSAASRWLTVWRNVSANSWNLSGWKSVVLPNGEAASLRCRRQMDTLAKIRVYLHVALEMPVVGMFYGF